MAGFEVSTEVSGPGVSASFVYDGVDRREQKTINGSLTEFLYDGLNPVQETSGATVLANLLTGLGIDEYFSLTDATGTQTFLTDALGSTVALTDATGTVQTTYTYEPFGATTSTGADPNPFQYTGREHDATGLYSYRARYYHPGLQRFISEDPIEFAGGDINLYAYAFNDPISLIDPTGTVLTTQFSLSAECRGTPPLSGRKDPGLLQRITRILGSVLHTLKCNPTLDLFPLGTVRSGIKVTEKAIAHILERHAVSGSRTAGKSVFLAGENIAALVQQAEAVTAVQQAGGRLQRIVEAGRPIGIDRATGQPTSTYTVITDAAGNL
jgi:RHS repeat-associated protein